MAESDLDLVAGLLANAEVMRYFPRPKTRAEALEWIHWSRRNYQDHGFGLWLTETRKGTFVGDCGLTWQPVEGRDELEVGYRTSPHMQGQGFATEAARACVDLALGSWGYERVVALVRPDNLASRRVAEKVGMRVDRESVVHGVSVVVYST